MAACLCPDDAYALEGNVRGARLAHEQYCRNLGELILLNRHELRKIIDRKLGDTFSMERSH